MQGHGGLVVASGKDEIGFRVEREAGRSFAAGNLVIGADLAGYGVDNGDPGLVFYIDEHLAMTRRRTLLELAADGNAAGG